MNLRSSVIVMNQAFAQFQVARTSSQERLTAKEESERQAANIKLDMIDVSMGINWKIVEEAMTLKTDIFLMQYLSRLN